MAVRDMDLFLVADVTKAAAPPDQFRDETLRLFDDLRDPLRRYLLCAGASPSDADDAVQESFLRLYRHLQKNGDASNLCGWVFQVARNYLRDERKSARRQRTECLEYATMRGGGPSDPGNSPEHCALDEERERRLRAAIEKLPEQQRECILLRSSGLRYREIAEILGIHTSGVGALVQRATARLSEELS
jgi:RNA polymerase sigma-70 factor (ECF subfamily)